MTDSSADPLVTIGWVSKRSGIAPSALRFYESRGLITSVRTDSGHRRYPRSALRRIAFIVFAQKIGLSLDEIAAELAHLPKDRVPRGADWKRLTRRWKMRIEQQIAQLQALNMGLDECIGCGCLSMKKCLLTNPGDRSGLSGPGPRRWLGDPS
ncbi:redox-sensitive transcriptional activator SoxR [Bordetella genomosp. 9]|uniref:redox-sensitive transcriptional activator SoxR n=1 Tax=Bordetella genomosp. 9 TaxID=1416803 RepID=UPI000A2924B4|nr:redox-sensitive transcriptional activator SoxR [Bordetella genomosp. 9]ARP90392.1 redox-sensitive transcriptional activator SoxR [Bordetella genomosp. 9]